MIRSKYTNFLCILAVICMILISLFLIYAKDTGLITDSGEEETIENTSVEFSENESALIDLDCLSQSDCSSDALPTGSAEYKDGVLKILKGGSYTLKGNNIFTGQIYVKAKNQKVQLVLDGVSLENDEDAPIVIVKADSVEIILHENSENTITWNAKETYTVNNENINAAIFSKCDLSFSGDGELRIETTCGHGVKSKDNLMISSGNLIVNAAEDGIHANDKLTISDGKIVIEDSNEGLEAETIEITGGEIEVTSRDDGLNASTDKKDVMPLIHVTGGSIHVDAQGDGLDSNGNLQFEGGLVIIDGPSDNGNGALDSGSESGGTCIINNGTVLALGFSGMAEGFSAESSQNSLSATFEEQFKSGDELVIEDAEGNVIYKYEIRKNGNSVIFSSADLAENASYKVKVGSLEVEATASKDGSTTNSAFPNMGMERGGNFKGQRDGFMKNDGIGNDMNQEGTMPEMPNREIPEGTPTEMPNREMPEGTPPEMPNGEMPEGTPPEMPEGTPTEM